MTRIYLGDENRQLPLLLLVKHILFVIKLRKLETSPRSPFSCSVGGRGVRPGQALRRRRFPRRERLANDDDGVGETQEAGKNENSEQVPEDDQVSITLHTVVIWMFRRSSDGSVWMANTASKNN